MEGPAVFESGFEPCLEGDGTVREGGAQHPVQPDGEFQQVLQEASPCEFEVGLTMPTQKQDELKTTRSCPPP
jgi:hypothetical protein